eukprot:gene4303-2293_t
MSITTERLSELEASDPVAYESHKTRKQEFERNKQKGGTEGRWKKGKNALTQAISFFLNPPKGSPPDSFKSRASFTIGFVTAVFRFDFLGMILK